MVAVTGGTVGDIVVAVLQASPVGTVVVCSHLIGVTFQANQHYSCPFYGGFLGGGSQDIMMTVAIGTGGTVLTFENGFVMNACLVTGDQVSFGDIGLQVKFFFTVAAAAGVGLILLGHPAPR